MNHRHTLLLITALLSFARAAETPPIAPHPAVDWPFFAFQNALQDAAHAAPESQVRLAANLGYAGIGAVYLENIPAFADACDHQGLRLFSTYFVLPIENPWTPDEALSRLIGRDAVLWVNLTSRSHPVSSPEGDAEAVRLVNQLAEHADRLQAQVVLYPHAGSWLERTADATRLARKINRPNVGTSFNLCHFLKVEEEATLEAGLRDAAPWLRVVSLNGAESGRRGGTWQELIQPLGRGSFDNLRLLGALRDISYRGPIGFQGYGIGGEAEVNLRETMGAWRDLNTRLAAETPGPRISLRFEPADDGGFRFDTGVLRGRLRAGGKSLGLTEVFHVSTGARLDRSNGLLSHYRVFTRGKRYGGGAWDWPGEAELRQDGSVRVRWPAEAERPFELRAVYRWLEADRIEVVTTVQAREGLTGFESFLACYFDPAFDEAGIKGAFPAGDGVGSLALFARATRDRGEWQMYPRDEAARQLIEDGRWTLEPNPVQWVFPARFAGRMATAIRIARGPGLQARLQADRDEAFA
ncbi:MAG: TIM barrel protein, partial [Verrucomicrobiae bacterium]|nr:TIM barrel protein [Verrucomicrobiae bacterium]